jgi:hypothetical protein
MILIGIFGGLGNQLFQYACAKAFANRVGAELKLDISHLMNRKKKDGLTFRDFQLGNFKLPDEVASISEVRQYIPDLWHVSKLVKLSYRLKRYLNGKKLYTEKAFFSYNHELDILGDNTYLYGYYQTEQYFVNFRQELLDILQLKEPLNNQNIAILDKIQNSRSVALHIRRGDFINSGFINHDFETYYNKAIRFINEKIENPFFFVFSNDPDWCRKQTEIKNLPHIIVDINDENHAYLDLYLISQCNHQICANSTFSWWGAWLNQHPEKIVIIPEKWYKNGKYAESVHDLIPESWLKI